MTVRALAAVFVLSVAAAGASAEAAPLRERPLAVTNGFPIGDSRTIAAWMRADGRVSVLLAGRRTVLTVAPPACPHLVAAGARHLLFQCDLPVGVFPPPPRPYVVLNPRTGAQRAFTVVNPYAGDPSGAEPLLNRLGDHWAEGYVSFHEDLNHDYVAWRTGKYVKGSEDPFGPIYRIDLDRPQLGRRLCRPFTRRPPTDSEVPTSDSFAPSPQVDGRWVLVRRADGTQELGRCGSRRRTNLGLLVQTIGSGYVAYDRVGRPTRLRRLRDGRTFTLAGTVQVLPVGGRAVFRHGRRLTLVSLPR